MLKQKRGVNMALDYNIIGERLKQARINKKFTQEKLAKQLAVSVAFFSRIVLIVWGNVSIDPIQF